MSSSTSWYLITRLPSEKGVLVEENDNNNQKWNLATMEKYMLEQSNNSLALGLMPRHAKNGSTARYPTPLKHDDKPSESQNGDALESPGDESSPSWASSSTGNTPSYGSGGTAFEFDRNKTENIDKLKNSATAPVITTTSCTPASTPVKTSHKKVSISGALVSNKDSKLSFDSTLRADLLKALEADQEGSRESIFSKRKPRKGSAGSVRDCDDSRSGTPSKGSSRLSRLLRRTHSAGCSKDVPPNHGHFPREKPPVTKTRSADAAPCSRDDEDSKQKRSRKTLAQDMKMRLSFLRRRHTDSSLQPSVRPPPDEVQKWSESFNDLMNSKYGSSLFRAFLSREFSEENIEFWLACEEYKRCRGNKLPSKARKIYDDFVAVQSPKEVNLDSTTRSAILDHLQNPDRHSFDSAQRRIQGLMEQDAYIRFLQSELYTELLQCTNQETTS